jgi:hypothetical protein
MKHTEAIVIASELAKSMKEVQDKALQELNEDFKASTSDNERASQQFDMHDAMAHFMIVSGLHSTYKKAYDAAKEKLDSSAEALGITTDVENGDAKMLFQNELFSFTKRRNKGGDSTPIKDFIIELTKLGVEKDTIQKAFGTATKPKKGSVYYEVTLVS